MQMIDGISQLMFNIYEAFTVAFYLKKKDVLDCLSAVTFAKSFHKEKRIHIEGTLPGWVLKHNEALIIPNFDRDESTLGYYGGEEGIKSFMGYPLGNKGVIIVDSKRKYVFSDKEKKHLGSFAAMISEELEREKRSLEREETLESLYTEKRIFALFNELNLSKISLLEILNEMLQFSGADFCFVGMEKKDRLVIQDIVGPGQYEDLKKECVKGESIASLVLEAGREMLLPHNSGYLREKPLFFHGEPLKSKQFFGFPLIADDVPFGVIGFVALYESHLKDTVIGMLRNLSSLLALYYTSLWMKENAARLREFDPVTGSVQFPTFLSHIEKLARKQDSFSLISIKLLNVSNFNRNIGVEATNEIIKRVFQVIKYCAGSNAVVSRKGAGHFYVLVRGTEKMQARNTLKLLNHTINKSLAEERLSSGSTDMLESDIINFPGDSGDVWNCLEKRRKKELQI